MSLFKFEVCKGYEDDVNVKLPTRGTSGSVGYDFTSPVDIVIEPKHKVMIATHVKCKMDKSIWLGIFSRSSMAKLDLHHYLGCGVIDSDYYGNEANDGDIGVILENTSDYPVEIKAGDRIAQGIFFPAIIGEDEVDTKRVAGFGSTGV